MNLVLFLVSAYQLMEVLPDNMIQAYLQTPTSNLAQSLAFYKKLQFAVLAEETSTFISDKGILVEVNPDRYARAGVKLLQENWSDQLEALQKVATVIPQKTGGYIAGCPSGMPVYLVETAEGLDFSVASTTPSLLGNFAGISLEVLQLEQAIQFWAILDFSPTMGGIDQGWIALANETGFTISFMRSGSCPHLFFNPSLTYFNGKDNLSVIEKVRQMGIFITEEITFFNAEGIVDNILIRDPGGLGFFIFSD